MNIIVRILPIIFGRSQGFGGQGCSEQWEEINVTPIFEEGKEKLRSRKLQTGQLHLNVWKGDGINPPEMLFQAY